jgi:hypothetical protein
MVFFDHFKKNQFYFLLLAKNGIRVEIALKSKRWGDSTLIIEIKKLVIMILKIKK